MQIIVNKLLAVSIADKTRHLSDSKSSKQWC